MTTEIKFGTDGWRAVIADGFTFDNVKRVVQAACDVVRKTSKNRLILIGYDRRFFSDRFADTSARVATANGFRVEIASAPISSPTLSFHVRDRKAAMGFMITASHNPPRFNGFKLKGSHGGSVDESVTGSVEERLDVGEIRSDGNTGKKVDFAPKYLARLKKFVRVDAGRLKFPIVFDAMHGPGGVLFEKLLRPGGKISVIRAEVDPMFGGVNPEPIETNLQALKEKVLATRSAIGLAVDGDADRLGVIDDKGRYLPPHVVMPLLLLHLIETRKLKGKIIQTLSMGYLTRRIADHFQLPFEEVPVGFKHIAKKMGEEKVLLGGEESGGYGVGLWFQERDGLLCALLLLEMLAVKKCPISKLVEDLEKRFGTSYFKRVDFPLKAPVDKTAWTAHLLTHLGKGVGTLPIKSVTSVDGIKIVMEDDSWFLLRPSGTEPLVRTYAEAATDKAVQELLAEANRLVHIPPPSQKKTSAEERAAKKRKARTKK